MHYSKKVLHQRVRNAVSRKLFDRIQRAIRNRNKSKKVQELRARSEVEFVNAKMFTGDEMELVIPDNVSAAVYLSGCFEAEDTEAMIEILNPGDVFFDIGSHIGYYSIVAANLVGSNGKVVCFEPTPSTFELLSKNVCAHKNVLPQNLAVFSTETELEFNDYGLRYLVFNSFKEARLENQHLEGKRILVKTVTLDGFVQRSGLKPDVMKIDAESVEMHVLEGSASILEKIRPVVMIEIGDFQHIDPGGSLKIINYMAGKRYIPYEYYMGKFIVHNVHEGSYETINLFFFPEEKPTPLSET